MSRVCRRVLRRVAPSKLAQTITFLICIRGCPIWISADTPAILTEVLMVFLSPSRQVTGIIPYIMPRPLLSTLFTLIQSLDAVQIQLLTASLDKQQANKDAQKTCKRQAQHRPHLQSEHSSVWWVVTEVEDFLTKQRVGCSAVSVERVHFSDTDICRIAKTIWKMSVLRCSTAFQSYVLFSCLSYVLRSIGFECL